MSTIEINKPAEILMEALPYIQKFRGQTIVIKYGGSAMENPECMQDVLRDIIFLEAVGINPVIVHGGGKAITQRMKEKGIQAKFVAGMRVTDGETMEIVEDVLENKINADIVKKFASLGGRAKSISGKSIFQVRKSSPLLHEGKNIDLGFVGDIIGSHVQHITALIFQEIVPVISPLGANDETDTYNINADIAAAEIAIALEASKIIFLSDVNGLLRDEKDPNSTISSINKMEIDELKKQGIIRSGMLPKVDSSIRALAKGVKKIHFIDGRIPHSLLLELFTDQGIGTEIVT